MRSRAGLSRESQTLYFSGRFLVPQGRVGQNRLEENDGPSFQKAHPGRGNKITINHRQLEQAACE